MSGKLEIYGQRYYSPLISNIKNTDGPGIDTTGTLASIWKSAKDNYEMHSEMTRINTDNELRILKYTDNDNFPTHLSIMPTNCLKYML